MKEKKIRFDEKLKQARNAGVIALSFFLSIGLIIAIATAWLKSNLIGFLIVMEVLFVLFGVLSIIFYINFRVAYYFKKFQNDKRKN